MCTVDIDTYELWDVKLWSFNKFYNLHIKESLRKFPKLDVVKKVTGTGRKVQLFNAQYKLQPLKHSI